MFTVKIDQACGDQLLIEAREVSRDLRGVLLQTESDTVLIGSGGYQVSLESAAQLLALGQCAAGAQTASQQENVAGTVPRQASLYVMNRFGATVATYRL